MAKPAFVAMIALIIFFSTTTTAAPAAFAEDAEDPIILSGTSNNGSYIVNMSWFSNDIQQNNNFHVTVLDTDMLPLTDASYTFAVFGDGHTARTGEELDSSVKIYTYVFEKPGSYIVRISNINDSDEYVEVPIQVTPEFPVMFFAVVGCMLVGVIAVSRLSLIHRF